VAQLPRESAGIEDVSLRERDGDALEGRRATFQPVLASAAAARALLREVLDDAGRSAWLEAGELAISEVVTNAILHAHTEIDVLVDVQPDRVFVEVRDHSPVLPVQRDYDDEATTGRGMGLVAAITLECGVHCLGQEGKVTWFAVGEPPELDADALLAAWDLDEEWPDDAPGPTGTVTVVLKSMPATLWLSARQHHDAVLRELVLYVAEHDDREVDLMRTDEARFHISNAVIRAVEEAQAAGTARPALPTGHPSPLPWVPEDLTLEIEVPSDLAPAIAAMQDTLDAGERLARSGALLVRPALPEIVAVRDWACEQVITQLSGGAAVAWAGTAQQRFETDVNDRDQTEAVAWDDTKVRTSNRGVVAADEANRIVAISPPLATLLGWDPAVLVGRRVVTLIPPSLREAHVAGFSRHLSSGEAHILGVPLELPVLRADGSELVCSFLVERDEGMTSRPIYLAWIEPIADPG